MINEHRVKLMTKMSVYEKTLGDKDARINSYFLTDYIGYRLLGSLVYGTIACMLGVAVYAAYNFEDLMLTIYSMDLRELLIKSAIRYIIAMVIFEIITFLVYYYRYNRMRNNLENYFTDLKSLHESYKAERNL